MRSTSLALLIDVALPQTRSRVFPNASDESHCTFLEAMRYDTDRTSQNTASRNQRDSLLRFSVLPSGPGRSGRACSTPPNSRGGSIILLGASRIQLSVLPWRDRRQAPRARLLVSDSGRRLRQS